MYAKIEEFNIAQQEIARFAKLFSHPARVAIIQLLAEKRTCYSGDIANEMPLNRATISQHLQELKAMDVIKGDVEGVKVCYCLNMDRIREMKVLFDHFFKDTLSFPDFEC